MTARPRSTRQRRPKAPQLQDTILPPPVTQGVDPTAASQDLLGLDMDSTIFPLVWVRDLKGTYSLPTPSGMTVLQAGMEYIVYGDPEVAALKQMGALVAGPEATVAEYWALVDPDPDPDPE